MSSLGSLSVFVIFTLATLILVGYMLNSLSNNTSLFIYYSQYLEKSSLGNRGEIEIRELEISPDNTSISLKLVNKCIKPLHVTDFPLLDVIFLYRSTDNKTRVKWLTYNPSRSLDEGWLPLRIEYGNHAELVNPVSGDFKSGLWDPGEALLIEAWVRKDEPVVGESVLIVPCIEGGGRN
ncbi:MAG: hypothetical protein QXP92_07005 [Nitrososphaerota archaeon]